MPPRTKRPFAGSQEESSKRANWDPLDTIRFKPLNDNAPMMFSPYLVQYYTQLYGQNLYMVEGDGFIDVKFVDTKSASCVRENVPDLDPPFQMQTIRSIDKDGVRVESPGRVTVYLTPRDVDHYDDTPCVPQGWTNPFPIKFKPIDTTKAVNPTEAVNPSEVVNPTEAVNPTNVVRPGGLPRRPPRLGPVYPKPAQPPAPSPLSPFKQPEWPAPDSILSAE